MRVRILGGSKHKVGAIKAWRKLAGPTNAAAAKTAEPSSIRALYGTDGTKNAVHGSDSFASALREINFCFRPAAAQAAAAGAAGLTSGGERTGETSEGVPQDDGRGKEQEKGAGPGGVNTGGYLLDGFAAEEKTLALLKPGVSELHSGRCRDTYSRTKHPTVEFAAMRI